MRFFSVGLIAACLIAEVASRWFLGLGAPPLSVVHPTIEYMFKPDQQIQRFGRRISINSYGMRSGVFPARKQPGETRLMVFGDSVINGGSLTDHDELATTLVQETLASKQHPVVVGNISAGSWGPGNWLAYAREFGFFEADAVALVISSHDAFDNPTFEPLNERTHPTKPPLFALIEGIDRYLPRVWESRVVPEHVERME